MCHDDTFQIQTYWFLYHIYSSKSQDLSLKFSKCKRTDKYQNSYQITLFIDTCDCFRQKFRANLALQSPVPISWEFQAITVPLRIDWVQVQGYWEICAPVALDVSDFHSCANFRWAALKELRSYIISSGKHLSACQMLSLLAKSPAPGL